MIVNSASEKFSLNISNRVYLHIIYQIWIKNTSLEKVMVDMINIIEISNSRVRRINLIYIFCIPYSRANNICLLKDEINKKLLFMKRKHAKMLQITERK